MIRQELRKIGDKYVVEIPAEEVERFDLHEGQQIYVEIWPAEEQPELSDEIREAFEDSWKRHEAAYRFLAQR